MSGALNNYLKRQRKQYFAMVCRNVYFLQNNISIVRKQLILSQKTRMNIKRVKMGHTIFTRGMVNNYS